MNIPFDLSKVKQPRDKYTIIRPDYNASAEALLDAKQRSLLTDFQQVLKKNYVDPQRQLVEPLVSDEDLLDTWTLIRFLQARDWNLKQAEEMYKKRMVTFVVTLLIVACCLTRVTLTHWKNSTQKS